MPCEPMINEKNRITAAHEYLAYLLLKAISKGLTGCSAESTFKNRVWLPRLLAIVMFPQAKIPNVRKKTKNNRIFVHRIVVNTPP